MKAARNIIIDESLDHPLSIRFYDDPYVVLHRIDVGPVITGERTVDSIQIRLLQNIVLKTDDTHESWKRMG